MFQSIWNTVFYEPIMNTMLFLYGLMGNNLGLAIIVLTVVIRVLLFPLMKNQYDASNKIKKIQPELEKIQKKYKRNPQKLQEEQIKLYRKVGYNPVGCFVSAIIPFPFLAAIYQAIKTFSGGDNEIAGIYGFVSDFIGSNSDKISIDTNFLFWDLSKAYLPLAKEHGYFQLNLIPYFILAALAGLSQYVSIQINNQRTKDEKKGKDNKIKDKKDHKKDKKSKNDNPEDMSGMMTDMSKSMSLTFPIMTGVVALSLPAALSLYWNIQSWVSIALQYVYCKFINKKNEQNNQK
ncbi:membrane protein insertase YidC [Candidatus Dojkabacteria bacterium]|nr:membrane protein insertase YidC [Candidatus Dojkabacteria bacterium]